MKQLTKEQAIKIASSGIWKDWTADEVVKFQLFQDKLCMDFEHYHKCIEQVLNRPIFTHEFASDDLKKEYLGTKPKPTLKDLMELFPKDTLIIIP